jgi:soluble lytic murein transglycosylase-like protein
MDRGTMQKLLRVALTQVALLLIGSVTISGFAAWTTRLEPVGEGQAGAATAQTRPVELAAHGRKLADTRGGLAVTRLQLQRATEVIRYSTKYRIPADLSTAIYDVAIAEGIHPALGFQLVKVESRFQPGARSNRGAIGYTQIRLPTARGYEPTITISQLHHREMNLRLGFRYLRDLLKRFDNDLGLALLAYNRGPTLVDSIVGAGGDPSNGYAEIVMRGLSRRATLPFTRGS